MNRLRMGDIVLGKNNDEEEWHKAEFLTYDEDLEYGKYVCLVWTHGGKIVECFDEVELIED